MANEIGATGLRVTADIGDLRSKMEEAAQLTEASAREQANSARKAEAALRQQERAARDLAQQLKDTLGAALSSSGNSDALGAALQRDADLAARMRGELDRLEASLKGVRASSDRQSILGNASAGLGQIKAQQEFLRSLQEQTAALGKSREELLALRAAELGVADAAAPMISRFREVAQASEAARKAEADQATALARVREQESFIAGLKSQAAAIGKTRTELAELKAAELGVANSAAPLIASIRQTEQALLAEASAASRAKDQRSFLSGLEAQANGIGKSRAELAAMRAAELGVAADAAPLIAKLKQAEDALEHVGHSSTGVRRELLVLGHELSQGNYSRFGGSLLVLGERMDILNKLMSPTGLLIGGVTAAVALLAEGMIKGALESTRLANALLLTGNTAGVTVGQIDGIATAVAASTRGTIGSVREILDSLVSSGKITRDELQSTAEVVQKIATISGGDAQKIAAEFEGMGNDVAAFAEKHFEQFGKITAAQIAYIRELQRTQGASAAAKQYTDDLNASLGSATQNYGYLQLVLHGSAEFFSLLKDSVISWGRTSDEAEEKVTSLTNRIRVLQDTLKNAGNAFAKNSIAGQIAELQKQLDAANAAAQPARDKAREQGLEQQRQRELVTASNYYDEQIKLARKKGFGLQEALAEFDKNAKLIGGDSALSGTLGASPDKIAELRKALIARFSEKAPAAGGGNGFRLDLKPLEDAISQEKSLLAERESALQRAYRLDQIGAADYFAQKRAALDRDIANTATAYQREIAIVTAAKAKAKDANQRDQLSTQLIDLQDKLTQATRDGAAKRQAITDEETAEVEKYRNSVDKLRESLQTLAGTSGQAAGQKFDSANRGTRAQATFGNEQGTLALLTTLRSYAVEQASLNDVNRQAQTIEQDLANTEARITLDRQVGTATQIDGMQRLQVARTDAVSKLQALYDSEQRIIDAAHTEALAVAQTNDERLAADAIYTKQIATLEQYRLKLDQLRATSDQLGQKLESVFEGNLSNAIVGLENGTKNLKSAFFDLARGIQTEFAKIAADDLARQLLSGVSGGAPNGVGGLLSKLIGGAKGGLGGASTANGPIPVTVVGGAAGASGAAGKGVDLVKDALGKAPAELKDVFGKIKDEFSSSLSSLGDLATSLFSKLSSAFASSGGADASGGFLASLFSSTPAVAGALASGGPTRAGALYQVNERGPELFTYANRTYLMSGDQGGYVTPAGQGGGGQQVVVHQPITVMAPQSRISRQTDSQLRTSAAQAVRNALARHG